jgi:cytoskeletal protein CcmA (bactofilin family)
MAAKNDVQLNSLIGEGSVFEGKFYIQGSLQIDGRFEGQIKTNEQVIVGETGKVKTDIAAKKVVVGGTVIGNIEAEEIVILLSTGRVLGNIRAPKVHVDEGVVVQGVISVSAGQQKDVKEIVMESFNTGPRLSEYLGDGKPSGRQTFEKQTHEKQPSEKQSKEKQSK